MSKSIVVFETPCSCGECMFIDGAEKIIIGREDPFLFKQLFCCRIAPEGLDEDEGDIVYVNDFFYEGKPPWCPLKKLPEKKGETKTISKEYNKEKNLIAKGYNLCISHILGEELPNF